MKLKILLILTLLLGLRLPAQAQSYPSPKDSIVWAQIAEGNFLEAIESYERMDGDLHPFFETSYQAFINRMLGRHEKSIPYYQELIERYLGNLDSVLTETCFWVMSGYSEQANRKDKLLWLEHKLAEYAKEPSLSIAMTRAKLHQIQDEVKQALQRLSKPRFHHIHRQATDTLPLKYDTLAYVPITLNGHKVSAMVDTGLSGALAIYYKTAKALGIVAKLKKIRVNDAEMDGTYTTIDSIRLGSSSFYNVPVMLFDHIPTDTLRIQEGIDSEKLNKIKAFRRLLETPIIGLKLLNRYGSVTMDIPNKRLILRSMDDVLLEGRKRPNFFDYNDKIFTNAKINGAKATLHLDTGHTGIIDLSEDFYRAHQGQLPLTPAPPKDTGRFMIHKIQPMKVHVLGQPKVRIANKELHLTDKTKELYVDERKDHHWDGVIGIGGLHLLGNKICFDFKNMHLSFED